ncbi:MAG: hypothetical protein K0R50_1298 [Eubacterium sp.]|nr:hypothetical protein [Eubacterium sp.]
MIKPKGFIGSIKLLMYKIGFYFDEFKISEFHINWMFIVNEFKILEFHIKMFFSENMWEYTN